MPNNGKGRSNYRVDETSVVPAKGYGPGRYGRLRVLWDSTADGDPGFADVEFDESPIDQASLGALIAGLNDGSVEDRWDLGPG